MNRILKIFTAGLLFAAPLSAELISGTGMCDITPPVGTPSAGYAKREGKGMAGAHDPLLATTLYLDNGKKQVAICAVDHLGFDAPMVEEVVRAIRQTEGLESCLVLIASSHTHSGGGAYLDMPLIGEMLAGKYDPMIRQIYIQGVVTSILKAKGNAVPAQIGYGSGTVDGIAAYRSTCPETFSLPNSLFVLKVTACDGAPIAALFNFALHPTTLEADNQLFSADFVGFSRSKITESLGELVTPIFINGAQAEVIPETLDQQRNWPLAAAIGHRLADAVLALWDRIDTKAEMELEADTISYAFAVQATPFGLKLPLENYLSEVNVLVLDKQHAITAVPGELSCIYDKRLQESARKLGYNSLSVFGLTNDAHGYIITPEAWECKTSESQLSFGGKEYGETVFRMLESLLIKLRMDCK